MKLSGLTQQTLETWRLLRLLQRCCAFAVTGTPERKMRWDPDGAGGADRIGSIEEPQPLSAHLIAPTEANFT